MITTIFTVSLFTAAAILLVLTLALFVQALGILLRRDRPLVIAGARPPAIILVPAHNEAAGIAPVVGRLIADMNRHDRVLVIADNCTDNTAQQAAGAGAEVLERHDAARRGKGYALSAGLSHIKRVVRPPDSAVVVFVDADCHFGPGGLERLVQACATHDAPVQCRNLMVSGNDQARQSRLGEFASRVRNDFRPTGYARLGLPCQLFGTGMAMPVHQAKANHFATGHVTEDLLIGVEAAMEGNLPQFVRSASLFSAFPETAIGSWQQKKRWVQGHLAVITSHAPRLMWLGFWRGDLRLIALAADLMTPPLSLLAAAHLGVTGGTIAFGLRTGAWLPLWVSACGLALFAGAMAVAWNFCGRGLIGWRELRQLPAHAARVALAAFGFAAGKRTAWIRADRTRLR